MAIRYLTIALPVCAAAFVSWVLYPGFPQPEELAGLTYGELVQRLGKPDFEMPGKFVAWNRERLVGTWVLEAGFDSPPQAGDHPLAIDRQLFLGIGSYRKKAFYRAAAAKVG